MERKIRTAFGTRLVQSRKRAGLTQDKLARLAGMAQCTLSEAERLSTYSGHTAQLARVLGVDAVWLATGEGTWDSDVQQNVLDLVHEQQPGKPGTPAAARALEPLSPLAHELGTMFDLLTDRIDRSVAYTQATRLFLDLYSHCKTGAQTHDDECAGGQSGGVQVEMQTDKPAQSAPAYPETQYK